MVGEGCQGCMITFYAIQISNFYNRLSTYRRIVFNFLFLFIREVNSGPLVDLGNRHSSRASALSYRHILLLLFLFRIISVCGRWC